MGFYKWVLNRATRQIVYLFLHSVIKSFIMIAQILWWTKSYTKLNERRIADIAFIEIIVIGTICIYYL